MKHPLSDPLVQNWTTRNATANAVALTVALADWEVEQLEPLQPRIAGALTDLAANAGVDSIWVADDPVVVLLRALNWLCASHPNANSPIAARLIATLAVTPAKGANEGVQVQVAQPRPHHPWRAWRPTARRPTRITGAVFAPKV